MRLDTHPTQCRPSKIPLQHTLQELEQRPVVPVLLQRTSVVENLRHGLHCLRPGSKWQGSSCCDRGIAALLELRGCTVASNSPLDPSIQPIARGRSPDPLASNRGPTRTKTGREKAGNTGGEMEERRREGGNDCQISSSTQSPQRLPSSYNSASPTHAMGHGRVAAPKAPCAARLADTWPADSGQTCALLAQSSASSLRVRSPACEPATPSSSRRMGRWLWVSGACTIAATHGKHIRRLQLLTRSAPSPSWCLHSACIQQVNVGLFQHESRWWLEWQH